MIMGGRKKKNVVYFRPKQQPIKRPAAGPDQDQKEVLKRLQPLNLAEGINNLLRALEEKGVEITDYDSKKRKLCGIQQIRGKLYFFAADPEEPESGR